MKLLRNNLINSQNSNGTLKKLDLWTNQSTRTDADPTFHNILITNDAVIDGDLNILGDILVQGEHSVLSTSIVELEDNIIEINSGQTSTGVTLNLAGVEINRGDSSEPYDILWNESEQLLKSGLKNNLLTLAHREDNPLDKGITVWDEITKKFNSQNHIEIPLFFNDLTQATSLDLAAIVCEGGVSINKNLYVGNSLFIVGTDESLATEIYTDPVSEDFYIETTKNIYFMSPNINIDINTPINFGNSSNKILFDNSDLNINTSGNLNISANNQCIFNNTTDSTSVDASAVKILGSLGVKKSFILSGSQDYIVSCLNDDLYIENNNSTKDFNLNLFNSSNSSNSSQSNAIKIYSLGNSSTFTTDNENLFIGYNKTSSNYEISSKYLGNGIAKNICIQTANNLEQILIGTDNILYFKSTIDSTSLNSGALQILGGVSITKNLNIGGNFKILSTENSSSNITGALQVAGGIYVAKDIFSDGNLVLSKGTQDYNIVPTGNNLEISSSVSDNKIYLYTGTKNNNSSNMIHFYGLGDNSSVDSESLRIGYNHISSEYCLELLSTNSGSSKNLRIQTANNQNQLLLLSTGLSHFENTTDSSGLLTGSLQIYGGTSISKKLYVGSNTVILSTENCTNSTSGALQVSGGIYVEKDVIVNQKLKVSSTENTVNSATGSLQVSGGIYAEKDILVNGNLILSKGSQRYNINPSGNNLELSSNVSDNKICMYTGTRNNNNSNMIHIYGLGDNSSTDSESLRIGYNNFSSEYCLETLLINNGISRNLRIQTANNQNQLLLLSTGLSHFENTTDSSGLLTGALQIFGGASISKKLYIGSNTYVLSTENSTGISSGSLQVSGGLYVEKDICSQGSIISLRTQNPGETSISTLLKGIELISGNMDLSNKYSMGIKFMSYDSSFTTENPKLLALIVGRATENYGGDTSGGMSLDFHTSPNLVGINSNPSLSLSISQTGQLIVYSTGDSLSSVTSSILTSGGIYIDNTTESTSVTNGGTITTKGGVSIGKKLYTGGIIYSQNTENSISSITGSMQLLGGLSISKDIYSTGIITLFKGTQGYTFDNISTYLNISSSTSGSSSNICFVTKDRDNTDNNIISIYGLGDKSISDTESLDIGYYSGSNSYKISSNITGTGVIRSLCLETYSNANQIVLHTDGTISCSSTLNSTSLTSAGIKLVGSISINNTTDASSITSGGTFTSCGGMSIGKSLYIGSNCYISSTENCTSNSSGCLRLSGGLYIAKDVYLDGKILIDNGLENSLLVRKNGDGGNIFNIDSSLAKVQILNDCVLEITNTQNSIGLSSGTLITAGGASITKDLVVGGNIQCLSNIVMNNNRIVDLAEPIGNTDAVNKMYVDSISSGLKILSPVKVATITSMTLTTDFEAGKYIDDVELLYGDRILIKNQINQIENGIYTVNNTGSPTRSSDFGIGYAASGSAIFIRLGTINNGTSYNCSTSGPNDIVGTNNLTFVQFTGHISVNVDSSSIEIFNDILRVSSSMCGTGLTGGSGTSLSTLANQSHVTSVGTLIAGTWNANIIDVSHGGTGNSTFTPGQILFGNTTSAISTSSNLFWDNTKKSLGINTNSPDPSDTDGLNLLDRDIAIKCSDNSVSNNGLFFQNSNNSYVWGIKRLSAGSGNAHLIISGGLPVTKANLTNNNLVLKSDSKIGINAANISDIDSQLYVNGDTKVIGKITSTNIDSGITSPTITTSDPINCTNVIAVYNKQIKNGSNISLHLNFTCEITVAHSLTSFQITLPELSGNLTNMYDINAQISGFTDNNLYQIQNIICTGISGTKKAIVQFQSSGILNHIIQLSINYNI